MKIAIASLGDPRIVGTWSGTPANIITALEKKGIEVFAVNLLKPKEPWYFNWLRRFYYRLQKKWFLAETSEKWLKAVGRQFDLEVAAIDPDVVVAIHGDILAHTTFLQPACLIHDTTFAALVDYYPEFTGLTKGSIKAGNQMYKLALKRAKAAIFSSAWATESAINYYGAPLTKLHTIPFGANLKNTPDSELVKQWIALREKTGHCDMLFIGVKWERKGGPDALRCVAELNRLGLATRLVIVGCNPVIPAHTEQYVQRIGFLKKDIESDAKKLDTLLKTAHALIVPSVAECYGCVYCEANAYGLPALARNTGGVSEIVKDGINGLLMAPKEMPEMLAKRWLAIWNNKDMYATLSANSRNEFEKRLNYDVFATKMKPVLNSLINIH